MLAVYDVGGEETFPVMFVVATGADGVADPSLTAARAMVLVPVAVTDTKIGFAVVFW